MSVTTDTVAVDPTGTAIEVLAVRFGESPFVERTPDGALVCYRERWDADSVVTPSTRVRLLTHHDRSRPCGWLDRFWTEPDGLHAAGTLVGSASKLDEIRALIGSGLAADVSVGFLPDIERDEWTAPARRNGLAAVRRRGARLREVSVVDMAGIPGSRVVSITAPGSGPSTATTAALVEAEAAVRGGSGYAARQRIDDQAAAALAIAEADAAVAAGQRWLTLDTPNSDEPDPTLTLPDLTAQPTTWRERADAEAARLWQLAAEDDARREYAESVARRQRAEDYAVRSAEERAAVWRAWSTR